MHTIASLAATNPFDTLHDRLHLMYVFVCTSTGTSMQVIQTGTYSLFPALNALSQRERLLWRMAMLCDVMSTPMG